MAEQKVTTPNVGIPGISVDTNTGADLPSSTPIPTENTNVTYDTSYGSGDNVGVPGVNIPNGGTTEGGEIKSAVEDKPIEQSGDATDEALRKQKELIDERNKNLEEEKNKTVDELKASNEQYLKDLEQAKADQIKAQEEADKKISDFEAEEQRRAKQIIDEQNALLNQEKAASIADLEAQKTKQRLVDEENIRQHTIRVEVEKQQSAWAFNKLGLAFSSGIILQSQKIAQDGAYQIATLKSNLVKNQTEIEKAITKVQTDYTTLVNENINKYNDLVAGYKRDAIDRINSITLNKLATSEEILREKKSIADNFRSTVYDLERQFRDDQKTLADDAVKNAEAIRINSDRIKNEKLAQLEGQLTSGNLSRMTPIEIAKLEKELGLSEGEISSKVNTGITSAIRSELDKIAGTDYYPDNMNDLVKKVNEEMKSGRDFQTALNNVMSREKANNPNIKKAIESKASAENAKLEIDMFKAETDRMKVLNDIAVSNTNQNIKVSEFEQKYGTLPLGDFSISDTANYSSEQRGTSNLQCGEYVNDTIKMLTGTKGGLGDTYESKINAINSLGKSDTPQVGGVYVIDTGTKYGHTGIIQSVNPDGTITVAEANVDGGAKGGPVVVNTYQVSDKMTFSNPIEQSYEGMSIYQLKQIGRKEGVTGVDSYQGTAGKEQLIKAIEEKQLANLKKSFLQRGYNDEFNSSLEDFKPAISELKTIMEKLPTGLQAIVSAGSSYISGDKKKAIASLESTLTSIEDAVMNRDYKQEDKDFIRDNYIVPYLREQLGDLNNELKIRYNTEKGQYYIDGIKDTYLNIK